LCLFLPVCLDFDGFFGAGGVGTRGFGDGSSVQVSSPSSLGSLCVRGRLLGVLEFVGGGLRLREVDVRSGSGSGAEPAVSFFFSSAASAIFLAIRCETLVGSAVGFGFGFGFAAGFAFFAFAFFRGAMFMYLDTDLYFTKCKVGNVIVYRFDHEGINKKTEYST
jgi:hypothetical protein